MLHIHNGDSSADIARESVPGEHFAWREALVYGPAPAGLDSDQWRQLRARHLIEAYDLTLEKCENDLRQQEEALSKFRDHEEVVLWFEHDLFCQINLLYLLNWLAQQPQSSTKLRLICIGEFPGIEDFRGLGQLTAEQLASLFPQRQEISAAQFALATRAWSAFTASNPAGLEELNKGDTSALPFLQHALGKHLQRFPSVRNGLGRIENLALELISSGQNDFLDLFRNVSETEPIYGLGDAQLFLELKRLAAGSKPLLISNPADAAPLNSQSLIKSSFQITEHGRAILRGDEDFARTNGIDLWLGGVHLHGNEAAWRWDEESASMASGESGTP